MGFEDRIVHEKASLAVLLGSKEFKVRLGALTTFEYQTGLEITESMRKKVSQLPDRVLKHEVYETVRSMPDRADSDKTIKHFEERWPLSETLPRQEVLNYLRKNYEELWRKKDPNIRSRSTSLNN